MKLEENEKAAHSLKDCKGCLKNETLRQALSKFPITSVKNRYKVKKANLFNQVLCDVTNNVVEDLEDRFKTQYHTSFIKQAKKHVPEFSHIKTSELTSIAKTITKDCEKQFQETSVER